MARTEKVRTSYTFTLMTDDIVIQKVTSTDVTTGRGRDYHASGNDYETVLEGLSPKDVARLVESAGDILGYLLGAVAKAPGFDERDDAFDLLGIIEENT